MSQNKTWLRSIGAAIVMGLIIITGCEPVTNNATEKEPTIEEKAERIMAKDGQPIPGQYIIVFEEPEEVKAAKAKREGFSEQKIRAVMEEMDIPAANVLNSYKHAMSGFVAELSDDQLQLLKNDERIAYVEQDKYVVLSPPKTSQSLVCVLLGIGCESTGGDPQVTPYGIQRVGGAVDGSGLTAWIIDTGVDLDHSDLNVNEELSTSFVLGESTADDGNGHGTHVAGTIAAIDNEIDVVGVAAGASVVGVKVLNALGTGMNSSVISGIDYVAANASPGDVANMSLGGGASQAVDDAVLNAAAQGVLFAVAAGNDTDDANNYSPARVEHPNVWTVSAIDENDQFASFSNYANPPVDYAAPGVDVLSLWTGGGTSTISGTSMSSPHVAGVLLVTGGNPSSDGTAIGDPDGNPDPIAVH